jgi:hypothetical protein
MFCSTNQNAPEIFSGAFCVDTLLCGIPSWDPESDYPTSAIQKMSIFR